MEKFTGRAIDNMTNIEDKFKLTNGSREWVRVSGGNTVVGCIRRGAEAKGSLLDISPTGARIQFRNVIIPLRMEDRFCIRILDNKRLELFMMVEVAWVGQGGQVGLKLIEINRQSRSSLMVIINKMDIRAQ